MERLLQLAKRKADEAEVFTYSLSQHPVSFEYNKLKSIERIESSSLVLRVKKDNRIGTVTASGWDNPEEIVEQALLVARFSQPTEMSFAESVPLPHMEATDPLTQKLGVEDLVDLGCAYCEQTAAIEGVTAHCNLDVRKTSVRLYTTAGFSQEYSQSIFDFTYVADYSNEEEFSQFYNSYSSVYAHFSFENVLKEVRDSLQTSLPLVEIPTGRFPVLFKPEAFSDLIYPVMKSVNGSAVVRGISTFAGKKGKPLLDGKITLIDDGLEPYLPSSIPFDDEGTPSQRIVLFDKGVLTGFYHSKETATQLGESPTGHGLRGELYHRDMSRSPFPAWKNVGIEPGTESFEQLVKTLGNGIIVDSIYGSEHGNAYGGIVHANLGNGYLVQNGEIVARTQGGSISVNVFDLLKWNVVNLSNVRKRTYNGYLLPSLLVDHVFLNRF